MAEQQELSVPESPEINFKKATPKLIWSGTEWMDLDLWETTMRMIYLDSIQRGTPPEDPGTVH